MNKYTRKQINKNASLHDKEFITTDDIEILMQKISKFAIFECGVDEVKRMGFFERYGDEWLQRKMYKFSNNK